MTEFKNKFGARIKEIRKSKMLTQEKLAEKIDLDIPNLSNIETGKRFCSAETLEKIAIALDVSEKDLFDFGHVLSEQDLRANISDILNNSDKSDLTYYYRVMKIYLENK